MSIFDDENYNDKLNRRLLSAVFDDNADLVKDLLDKGADPNWRSEPGHDHVWGQDKPPVSAWEAPAIRVASSPDVLQILLDNGADPNLVGRDSPSAMHSHQILHDPEMLRTILAGGGSPNDLDRMDDPPLRSLVHSTNAPVECYELLLDAGAHVDHQDRFGCTALMTCRQPEVAELLVLRGADPDLVNTQGKTAWDTTGREVQEAMRKAQAELAARELHAAAPKIDIPSPSDALARLRSAPQREVAPRARRL